MQYKAHCSKKMKEEMKKMKNKKKRRAKKKNNNNLFITNKMAKWLERASGESIYTFCLLLLD